MMLFWPPPPRRVAVRLRAAGRTPGVNAVRLVKLPWLIGRFSTSVVVIANERSPLCDWISGASAVTLTVSVGAAGFERQCRHADAVAAADRDAGAHGAEAVHRDFDGVGVRR